MSLTFMKNKYIDLSISFCYLVCLFLQNICLYFAQIFSNMDAKADKDKWAQGTITERGVTVLFKISYHSAWLLVGWVLAGGGASTPTVCIAVDGAAGDSCNVSTIFSGTSVTFALAEDRKTIQFNNPYGNVCFWHAMRV